MKRPNPTTGLRHVALNVQDLVAAEHFYVELMGMSVEWRPDEQNVYLTSGNDNLALHVVTGEEAGVPALDHIGFFLDREDDVDDWFEFLKHHGVKMKTQPRKHRDGAKSFYCYDPSGVTVQIICHPPLVGH
ncbi:MAG: catechol 2,3-dioxygenase-like lactoylglutathione lyase family enzyme [Cycloclasticus pugetii]|jgi:catechol 2,3-dioxygenase-like lactoylglutathione lyase family enzyme|uniref:Extradiol dioxygenase of the viccinal chelate superfamily n=1 Tax=Cycloclasticus zancles 78-ME TaxID=1198232 RepID=S5TUR8_9GAMM|nr:MULTISPECIES: VOC family protein [Cycloclasticus]AFT68028.1 Glyoxalase family protein [Cycloclasticus sp. P1]AGS38770.1 Extradiol dioxygenase of the viccinal chelate superfamily [Cycloclasticus zancles 78-ME]MBV1899506.1 VOC family protein [Cycloclasticus sp.]MDF1830064.1 VOC family protein [Cycloclasticus pugetii]PHR50794.1 MAG: VOC family protein [Cycloclasticus sp.]